MTYWSIQITLRVDISALSLVMYVMGVQQWSIKVALLCKLFLQNWEARMDLLMILVLIYSVVTDGITIELHGMIAAVNTR
jgi:hypothetical protein